MYYRYGSNIGNLFYLFDSESLQFWYGYYRPNHYSPPNYHWNQL